MLIFSLILSSFIGAAGLYSAADGSYQPGASRHLIRFYVFLLIAIGISFIDIKIIYKYSYALFGLSLLLLISVEVIGVLGKGATRWIRVFGFSIQPSELVKITIILALAKFYHDIKFENIKKISYLFFPFLILAIPFVFVVIQPDLGTAVIIFAPLLPMLLWAGVSNFTIFLMIAPIITILAASNIIFFTVWAFIMFCFFLTFQASVVNKTILYFANIFTGLLTPFLWNNLADYQKQRILTFLNPDLDPMGSAYHIIQSITAIGSGGLFGKGWGAGSQTQLKFLPVQESDFILSVIAEEFGFFGISCVMLLCFLLIKTLLDIAFRSSDYFASLVIVGLASILLSHIFINSAMTIGLMPVKGLPIPFISAGGSFLLSCFIMIGLVINFSKN